MGMVGRSKFRIRMGRAAEAAEKVEHAAGLAPTRHERVLFSNWPTPSPTTPPTPRRPLSRVVAATGPDADVLVQVSRRASDFSAAW
jgi:hypothetical protein